MSETVTEVETQLVLPNLDGSATPLVTPAYMDEVLSKVRELKHRINESYLELGEKLYEIKKNDFHKEWGYSSFADFCKAELSFEKRKADYLSTIWGRFCDGLGVEPSRISHLSWAKMGELARIANEDNVDGLIVIAENKTVEEIKEYVKSVQDGHIPQDQLLDAEGLPTTDPDAVPSDAALPEPPEIFQKMTFALSQGQMRMVQAALERAEQVVHSDKQGHLLDLICTEFVTSYAEYAEGGVSQRLQFFVANLNRLFPGANISMNPSPEFDPDQNLKELNKAAETEDIPFGGDSEDDKTQ